jgi:hypothetical protein
MLSSAPSYFTKPVLIRFKDPGTSIGFNKIDKVQHKAFKQCKINFWGKLFCLLLQNLMISIYYMILSIGKINKGLLNLLFLRIKLVLTVSLLFF